MNKEMNSFILIILFSGLNVVFGQQKDILILKEIVSFDQNDSLVSKITYDYDSRGNTILFKSVSFHPPVTNKTEYKYNSNDQILSSYSYSSNKSSIDSSKYVYHKDGYIRYDYRKWINGDTVIVENHINLDGFCILKITTHRPAEVFSRYQQFVDSMMVLNDKQRFITKRYDITGGADLSSPDAIRSLRRIPPKSLIYEKQLFYDSLGNKMEEHEINYFPSSKNSTLYVYDSLFRLTVKTQIIKSDTTIYTYTYVNEGDYTIMTEKINHFQVNETYKYPKTDKWNNWIESISYGFEGEPLTKHFQTYSNGYLISSRYFYYPKQSLVNTSDSKSTYLKGKTEYSYLKFVKD